MKVFVVAICIPSGSGDIDFEIPIPRVRDHPEVRVRFGCGPIDVDVPDGKDPVLRFRELVERGIQAELREAVLKARGDRS